MLKLENKDLKFQINMVEMKDQIKLKISRREEIINYGWKSINCANNIQK